MSEIKNGQRWRHKKRGGVYEIVDDNAHIQISSFENRALHGVGEMLEEARWVAYRPINGHALYFRMYEEFGDGRFEKVKEAE